MVEKVIWSSQAKNELFDILDYVLFYEIREFNLYILTIKSSKQNPKKFRIT